MSKKKGYKYLLKIVFSAMLLAGTTGCDVYKDFVKSQLDEIPDSYFKNINRYIKLTTDGKPVLADVENPIGIVIQNACEEDKKKIISTIEQMNDFCPNLDFTLTDKNNIHIENKINIYTDYDTKLLDDRELAGLCISSYDSDTAKIVYPVNIYIDSRVKDYKNGYGDNIFTQVLKHELMHSLGFLDMSSDAYQNKTIMYEGVQKYIDDFTKLDIYNIKQLYDEKTVVAERPKKLDVFPYKKEEELEM